MDRRNDPEGEGGDEGGGGDRQDPGPHDPAGDAPLDRRQTASGADANDRTCDGVRCGDRRSGEGDIGEREGCACFRTETADGFQFGNLGPHRVDDSPPT